MPGTGVSSYSARPIGEMRGNNESFDGRGFDRGNREDRTGLRERLREGLAKGEAQNGGCSGFRNRKFLGAGRISSS